MSGIKVIIQRGDCESQVFTKVRTKLEGYEKQVFPKVLDKLNETYRNLWHSWDRMMQIGSRLPGLRKRYLYRLETEDRYSWGHKLRFKTKGGEIVVLFPWECGGVLDRSIAFYTKGEIDSDWIEEFAKKLLALMIESKEWR